MRNALRVLFTLLLASAQARAADGFKEMAREISKAAKKAGIERVAVLSFVTADGRGSSDGWTISEKLTTQVVHTGRVQTVERSLLKKLLEEHYLSQTGILEQSNLKKVSEVLSVDGLITGSFVIQGTDVIIQARLINIVTGVIVMASEGRVAREWSNPASPESAPKSDSPSAWIPDLYPPVPSPAFSEDDPIELQDDGADNSCENAAERMDGMNKKILDLKARYWALQLKRTPPSGIRYNPGSEITDPQLKKEFYDRMRAWIYQGDIPALSASEVKRFVGVGSKVFDLSVKCGI